VFRQGLSEAGFVEGRNVVLEFQWAEGQYDRLPALANSLVARNVAIIVATGGTASAIAAKLLGLEIPTGVLSLADEVIE
jgi:putative tryptophan/tyrosine transport system substrate-binding protein